MKVSEKEMNLALEILRINSRPTLNNVLEMVIRYNSRDDQSSRLDFMKINLVVAKMMHTIIPAKVVLLNNTKIRMEQFDRLLAVA